MFVSVVARHAFFRLSGSVVATSMLTHQADSSRRTCSWHRTARARGGRLGKCKLMDPYQWIQLHRYAMIARFHWSGSV